MNRCQICILVIAIAGYGAGFVSHLLYQWIREANACEKYWTKKLEELQKGG
jgi:hypothetical protein